ncbi:MAG: ATP-binding protein, partial [bacterium]
ETKRPEGENIYANYKFSPLRKENEIVGAVIIVEDISKKIHLQKELDRANGYIGHLVENSADAIISTDLDGTIVTWNKGAETMFGFSGQAAIGRPWNFLAAENDRKKLQNLFQWVKKSGAISNFRADIITMSGEPLPISLTISLIKDNDGHIYGISGIFKDLSEAKKIKKQMIQSQRMISLGAMATSMAHDINDPLASLSTYTHLLMTRTKGFGIAQLTDNLAKVEEDADKIGQMVKDLLWYATPSDHALGMVDIHEILKKSLSFAAYQVNVQKIEVKKDLSAKESLVMVNSRELIQALVNILTNAVESMPDGGTMTIQTTSANGKMPENEEKGILIKIRDTGIGIPEGNISRIFEQFFTTRSDEKGNGLGLYVARAIIEDHHGSIEVESEIDKGTCFTIRLPLRIEN